MREKSSSEDLKSRRTGFTRTTKTASSVVGAVAVAFIVILVSLSIGVAQSNAPHPSSAAWTALTQTSPSTDPPQFSYGLTSPNAQTDGYFGISVAISGTTVVVGAPDETVSGETGAGHAYIFNTKTGLVSVLTSPNAQTGGYFGDSVAVSGTTVVVGAPLETASGDTYAGHAYTFNATTGDLLMTLTSPNAQFYGYFGDSVAVSGTTVVVGAPFETASGESYAGHAYIVNTKTGLMSVLITPNAQTGGCFGDSVAVSGTTVVVGAPDENASGLNDAGHAFTFNATTGDLISTFTSPNAQSYGYFGWSVAISGTTVLVGAYGETASGDSSAGHAYSFSATTGDLISTLTSPNARADGYFGLSVAISGATVVVGAPFETASGKSGAGHAYRFSATTGDLISTLTSPNFHSGGAFGYSVAISGSTIVVGAPDETVSGDQYAGHGYVFGTMPLGITSPNAQTDGYFGYSVAISGTTVVVGALGETASGDSGAGHAYVINTKTGVVSVLTSPNAQSDGEFGYSVAVSGTTVVVGAYDETVTLTDCRENCVHYEAGRAYTFNAITGDLISTFTAPDAQSYGWFGYSVAISGTTVVVGGPYENSTGYDAAGHAYIFNSTTGDLISTLTSPNARTDGYFGTSVAISGTTVVVGAVGETVSGDSYAGHAYTFNATKGDLISTLNSPNAQTGGEFGYSVAISGATVVVGAPYENASGKSAAGHAYTFSATTGDLISTLTSPNARTDGYFGYSVAINGTTVVVGAPHEKASADKEAGRAYTFSASRGDLISTLTSPNAQYDGVFGLSVANSGTKVTVGAPYEKASGEVNAGHAYLF